MPKENFEKLEGTIVTVVHNGFYWENNYEYTAKVAVIDHAIGISIVDADEPEKLRCCLNRKDALANGMSIRHYNAIFNGIIAGIKEGLVDNDEIIYRATGLYPGANSHASQCAFK